MPSPAAKATVPSGRPNPLDYGVLELERMYGRAPLISQRFPQANQTPIDTVSVVLLGQSNTSKWVSEREPERTVSSRGHCLWHPPKFERELVWLWR